MLLVQQSLKVKYSNLKLTNLSIFYVNTLPAACPGLALLTVLGLAKWAGPGDPPGYLFLFSRGDGGFLYMSPDAE